MRRRLATLLTTAALVGSLLTAASTTPAVAKSGGAPLSAPDLDDFVLSRPAAARQLDGRADGLADRLATADVQQVMSNASRQGRVAAGKACNPRAIERISVGPHAYMAAGVTIRRSICFASADAGHLRISGVQWTPQGVTTVADARSNQRLPDGSSQPVIVSWYNGLPSSDLDQHRGARISFVDPRTGRYEHALLVYPTADDNYMTLRRKQKADGSSPHVGGIVWYGDYLYVADGTRGLRVFSMKHILDLGKSRHGNTTNRSKIGRHGGTYYGLGYRYLMPEVDAYTSTTGSDRICTGGATGSIFSFVGLDRTGTNHLTTGEYCNAQDSTTPGRVAAWPLQDTGGRPRLTGGEWRADAAYNLPAGTSNYQGAVRSNGRWYLSSSDGAEHAGRRYRTVPVSTATGTLKIDPRADQNLTIGPEDLSLWPGSSRYSGLWTVSEHPTKRMLYSIG